MKKIWLTTISVLLVLFVITSWSSKPESSSAILFHIVDLEKQDLQLYLKDNKGQFFENFKTLAAHLKKDSLDLIFAMNGGMYKSDLSPQGLYIENGKYITNLDTIQSAYGNFYMQPNGIFYITTSNKGVVCQTSELRPDSIKFATQSGPMLLINGKMHYKFRKGSKNLNIRNGVGILPDGNLIFAMSKEKINFFDFATFFKNKGCKNALYLDGYVSKTFLPSKDWNSKGGTFGVIIGETERIK